MGPLEWTVFLEAEGDEHVDDDRVVDFAEALSEFGATVAHAWGRYSAQFSLDESNDTVEAHKYALDLFMGAAQSTGLPAWPVTVVEIKSAERLDRELAEPNFPRLVGVAEVAELLDVNRQRASQVTRTGAFPGPIADLAMGPVWTEPQVLRFVEAWQRKPGRPKKTNEEAGA